MSVDAGTSQQQGVKFRGREVAACPCTGFLKMTIHPIILTHTHTHTHTHDNTYATMHVLCNQSKLLSQRDITRHVLHASFLRLIQVSPVFFVFFSRRSGGRAGEGEERGEDAGGRSQRTPTLKGHPLSAVHSVAARPR